MLIHSFGDDPQAFSDYRQFLTLFNVNDVPENSIVYGKKVGSIDLFFSWVEGDPKYLKM